ncbi:MAG: polysaccharide biosynthesis protein [Bacteroidetes bacterium]|nr:polysaccharide biosynthesis protein [Bacteroidota bacterium]
MIRLFVRFIRNLRILPWWVIVFIDVSVIAFSALIGYLLRFNFSVPELLQYRFQSGILAYTFCGLISILITNSHRGIIRYTGIQDGVRIFYMSIVNVALICSANLISGLSNKGNIVPYSVISISFLSSFLLLFNYRLLVKYIFSYYRNFMIKQSRVVIFGAGQTGIITRHVLESTPRMKVIGFLEDAPDKTGKVIDGIPIFDANTSELQQLLEDFSIDELIFTPRDISLERKNEVVDACMRNQIKVRTVPPVEKWVKGELSINQIKEINIEELLGRESIKINNRNIETDLRGKKVLITGAAGSIGSELFRQVVLAMPSAIILVDQAESALYELEREARSIETSARLFFYIADVNNKDRMRVIFEEHRPSIVYHAAAYKHVPMMENNPSEAITCNILGTKTLADLTVEFGVSKFVMVSTDKAVNPTNVMGCSKRIAEIYVQSLNDHLEKTGGTHTAFVTTRFGNVLGSNGSVIPLFKKQIQEGGPITVTHPDITRYFMTIPEACQLVLEAGTMGEGGEIFIFDMGKSVKILDLAEKMIWLSGLEPRKDIDIVFTGLREGEKLFEELLNTRTHHQKIMIAKVQHYGYEEINRYVELFEDLVYDKNELKSVALMKELVPEYKSNYSRYEVLDKQH